MRRRNDAIATISSIALAIAVIALAPGAVFAQKAAEAELHHVDPGSGRISARSIGYLRFTPGKGSNQVDILVQILNLTEVQGEEPLMTESGFATYRHGMRIRAQGDCEDMKPSDSQDGVLPDVGVRQNGSATLTITADGIAMSELPGKSVVLYRGSNAAKRQIIACGVIKED